MGDVSIRKYPRFAEEQDCINNVVSAESIGQRITALINNPELNSGHTEWIGAKEDEFIQHCALD